MTKVSATRPAPSTAPRRTSRKKPLTREAMVQPPTVKRLRSIRGSDLRFDVLGAAHFTLTLATDPLRNEVKRPPFHFRENPTDIFTKYPQRQQLNSREERH